MLKGSSLKSEIETLAVDGATAYRITDEPSQLPGASEPPGFCLCLDDVIASDVLDALSLDDETVFICQDAALYDSQKVNLSLQCVLKTI